MNILVTNDDGIFSNGILALAEAMSTLGTVTVVAPDRQQSAVGHAVTVSSSLRATEYRRGDQVFGWAVNGTPADCVKLGISTLLPQRPDIVVSGVNHGANTSINVLYSGTVSAATEGMFMGIPSLAVSLTSFDEQADCRPAAALARSVAEKMLGWDIPKSTLLNLNVPAIEEHLIKGIRVTRQGSGSWDDVYEERLDPHGKPYYWLRGTYNNQDAHDPDTDDGALANQWASLTPITYNLTDLHTVDTLRDFLK